MARAYRPKDRAEIARNMSAIRSRNNRTELALRKTLHAMGFRYRIYSAQLPGRPDIIFRRERVAIFVDGDYWHSRTLQEKGLKALKRTLVTPTREYWLAKFQRNVARDAQVNAELRSNGWTVLRYWESDLKRDVKPIAKRIARVLKKRRR